MTPRFIPRAGLPESEWLANLKPPVEGLWHIGRPLEELEPRVAIVGARDATTYGLDVARMLAADLAARGVCIVSGMARGIDTAAHLGALSVPHGRTIAVLAGGVDKPYPRSSTEMYEEIPARGAVVSENKPGSDNRKEEFVKRNRIIVGLARVVVIVQGDRDKSGAMKTAVIAAEIGRDLMAVPGDIRSVLSSGPHDLLRSGHPICAGAPDVLRVLGMPTDMIDDELPAIPDHLPDDQKRILGAVLAGPARADELGERCGLDVIRASRALARLELSGLIRRDATSSYTYV